MLGVYDRYGPDLMNVLQTVIATLKKHQAPLQKVATNEKINPLILEMRKTASKLQDLLNAVS
jgi:hypothetical protein